MENFDWTHFTQKIAVKAELAELYNAWASAAGIEKWFLEKAVYVDSQKNILPKNSPVQASHIYEWQWFAQDFVEHGKIVEANGRDLFQFTFAGECLVEISLNQNGEYVIVELTQKNIPTDEVSKKNIRLGCFSGWAFYLVNLKSVFEGGLDLRNKNPEFVAMVNN